MGDWGGDMSEWWVAGGLHSRVCHVLFPVRASERACPQKASSPISSLPAQLVLPTLAQLNNRMLLLTWELLCSH